MGRKKPSTSNSLEQPDRIIAAYVRVSSFRQATEGDSLEAQQNMITEYVRHQLPKDRSQIVFYVERGKSGKNQNRPELQRLRRDIEAGKVGTVVAFKLDRITRSTGAAKHASESRAVVVSDRQISAPACRRLRSRIW
jgi:DNA invertase Pin-like site-specific DNA recombinase